MKRKQLVLFDDDGVPVKAGDTVRFSYGIPPVVVDAPIVQRRGSLIALTPGHDPKECNLRSLRKQVSCWFKSEARPDPLTAMQASKRKATRQRDNWRTRYLEALELIAKYGGKTECEDGVACTGSWCAEQTRVVLREGEEVEATGSSAPACSAEDTMRRIAGIAHHGGLLDMDVFTAVKEIRKLSLPWWDRDECGRLQRQNTTEQARAGSASPGSAGSALDRKGD